MLRPPTEVWWQVLVTAARCMPPEYTGIHSKRVVDRNGVLRLSLNIETLIQRGPNFQFRWQVHVVSARWRLYGTVSTAIGLVRLTMYRDRHQ
ncbi:uncharacterized protein F5147DRAFT_701709, partial [Suillus discolor]